MDDLKQAFQSLDYGEAPESAALANQWLDDNGRKFGHFIDGKFENGAKFFWTTNPATGEKLAQISHGSEANVNKAAKRAEKAQPLWQGLSGFERAKYLYALARQIQKNSRLFAVLESLDNGKPIRESRDIDIPLVARHFYYHAGWAQRLDSEFPNHQPYGVCGQIIPWNFPLLMLAWKIAPALAAGNTVVLKPAEFTSLTALLFAQICQQVGLPKGVVNIVTGEGDTGAHIVKNKIFKKIAFTGSTDVGKKIREATAGRDIGLSLELGGKSPYLVFADADIDSAIEGLVDAIWFNQGQVCCAGSRLLVHESIADKFHKRLKKRMDKLILGDPLDKSIDIGALVAPVQLQRVQKMLDEGKKEGGSFYEAKGNLPAKGSFMKPTLVSDVSPAHSLVQEEIFGPVLVSMTFRTPEEAVALANNSKFGLAATIWSENINLALDIAPKIKAGVVWINSANQFDAAAGFGGYRESGFGREGGKEGMYAYLKPTWLDRAKLAAAGKPSKGVQAAIVPMDDSPIDQTAKMYVGGKQARGDSGYARPVIGPKGETIGQVCDGNRKDIRNAVEAAIGAAGWANTTQHLKAQILYFMGENLAYRADEFAKRLRTMTGVGATAAKKEVDLSIERLFAFAGWADKYDGAVHSVPSRTISLAMNEPVGTLGIVAPKEAPLLASVSMLAPAIAMGNRIVLVPSADHPLAMTDFYQVLETSDLPAGVVNIVTGDSAALGNVLAEHDGVDGLWFIGEANDCETMEKSTIGNLKQAWTSNGKTMDWSKKDIFEGEFLLQKSTQVKNIWVPYGA